MSVLNKNDMVVLIPHYNDCDGLIRSLASIHRNEHIDILVVDDGSTRNLIDELAVRKAFAANGDVNFLYLDKNRGIEHALNFGLEHILSIGYKYIARLDSGDICLGDRFAIQHRYLEENPDIMLIGSHVNMIDMEGNLLFTIKVPVDADSTRKQLYISSSTIIHPSIMFNSKILKDAGMYPTDYKNCEDYAFYFNILKHFRISNIDKVLVAKEINPQSISVKNRNPQARTRIRVIAKNFYLGYHPLIGLIRNTMLYLIPNKQLDQIKKLILKK